MAEIAKKFVAVIVLTASYVIISLEYVQEDVRTDIQEHNVTIVRNLYNLLNIKLHILTSTL